MAPMTRHLVRITAGSRASGAVLTTILSLHALAAREIGPQDGGVRRAERGRVRTSGRRTRLNANDVRETRLWGTWAPVLGGKAATIAENWEFWVRSEHPENTAHELLRSQYAALDPGTSLSLALENRTPIPDLQCLTSCHVNYRPPQMTVVLDKHLFSCGDVGRSILLRLSAILPLLSLVTMKAPQISAEFTIGLGDDAYREDVGFCARDSDKTLLVPDPVFIASGGYLDFRQSVGALWVEWAAREKRLFWRGSTTGAPRPPRFYRALTLAPACRSLPIAMSGSQTSSVSTILN